MFVEAVQPCAQAVRLDRPVPRVEVEGCLDLVVGGDEAQFERA